MKKLPEAFSGKSFDPDRYKEGLLAEEKQITEITSGKSNPDTPVNVWAKQGNNYFPIEETVAELPPNFYSVRMTMQGIMFTSKTFDNDEIIDLPDAESDKIISHTEEFWKLSDTFKTLGFLHKRGILLYGAPGTGKSVTVYQVGANLIKEQGGVVLYPSSPYSALEGVDAIRAIHRDLKIIMVLEDIDDLIYDYGDRTLTALLDGENKTNNILFLATTNYPERLPPRIVNRPSRFDVIEEMKLPTTESRRKYLSIKAPSLSSDQLDEWVSKTQNFSIPMLKELVISVLGYLKPLDASIATVRELMSIRF